MADERVKTIANAFRALGMQAIPNVIDYVSEDEVMSEELIQLLAEESARCCAAVVNTKDMEGWTPYANPDKREGSTDLTDTKAGIGLGVDPVGSPRCLWVTRNARGEMIGTFVGSENEAWLAKSRRRFALFHRASREAEVEAILAYAGIVRGLSE